MDEVGMRPDEVRAFWKGFRRSMGLTDLDPAVEAETFAAFQIMLPELIGRRRRNVSDGGIHARLSVVDIVDCETQREAWRVIARLSGGLARPADGAHLLVDAGLASGRRFELMRNASSWMAGSDEWERAAPGTYRLLEGRWWEEDSGSPAGGIR